MAGVNKVIILGNLGIDPEVRTLESGVKVCRLSIATSESYTNKSGDRVEQTEWHSVTLWRHLAETAEKFLRKGNKVYIEGKLRTRSYKDKDGVDRYVTEIIGDTIEFMSPASGDRQQSSVTSAGTQPATAAANPATQTTTDISTGNEDDLPF